MLFPIKQIILFLIPIIKQKKRIGGACSVILATVKVETEDCKFKVSQV
jgi:hypothetical protein